VVGARVALRAPLARASHPPPGTGLHSSGSFPTGGDPGWRASGGRWPAAGRIFAHRKLHRAEGNTGRRGALVCAVTGVWALLATIVVATAIGLTLRHRDGRFRRTRATPAPDAWPSTGSAGTETSTPRDPASTPRTSKTGTSSAATTTAPGSTAAAGRPPVAAAAPGAESSASSLASELQLLGQRGGERATLLQFSTAFCGPCRTTRAVLADVARLVPGVAHVEVDAEAHLDLVRRLGVRRTPTVLVLDADAREVSRASGAPPSRAAVIAALGPAAAGRS